ncbi:MAG: methyl-accepting chemotaxis protein [Anaeromyxobacteraceae bacterium]
MNARRYALWGAMLGFGFPLVGTIVEALHQGYGVGLRGLIRAQSSPLLWIIDTAPIVLTVLAGMVGLRQDSLSALSGTRKTESLSAAGELVAAAQSLLSTVSSFSSMTAETAASVRETTATMGQLGQTATKAALTAETVIGLARQGEKISLEGLDALDESQKLMGTLTTEVRGLSDRIEALNARMRDIFEIATVVNFIADRSQRLAEHADQEVKSAGAAAPGLSDVVGEMRHHAEDAKRAAAQVKVVLSEVHKAMLAAMTAAELGTQRAEQGAQIASKSGETIKRLAAALRDSSQAAKEIAVVAQQQDHGIDQVLKAMNEIYLATQETMTSTQNVASEAKALNDLASELKKQSEG